MPFRRWFSRVCLEFAFFADFAVLFCSFQGSDLVLIRCLRPLCFSRVLRSSNEDIEGTYVNVYTWRLRLR